MCPKQPSRIYRNFRNTYPLMLQLDQENISAYQASFLDLPVIVEKNLSLSSSIREMHSFLLLFACYIWTATFYSSIGSGILRFARSNLGIISFVGVSNRRNKGVQGSKHRSVISMLNKIFGKHVTIFKDLIDTTEKFIKLFLLP